ncbi:MAG TPA: MBL fold metallo-hydrolase [Anaeromyxobacteraceae bacterium]|nr:MBL fold metallo-hydrolase [Anaeromyxobacteraceae bacterium]
MESEALDECRILVIVDNETDTLSSVDDGVPQVPELAGHVERTPARRTADGRESREAFEHLCVACHGFSALVTARRGETWRTVLFDVGPSADVWLANARKLAVELAAIDAVFLSHWHFDHSGALPEVVAAVARARREARRPAPVVDVHPERPDQRGLMMPNGLIVLLPPEPTLAGIGDAGGAVELHAEAHLVGGGFFLGSGEIERTTSYETGLPGHHSIRGGVCAPDPLIEDERYLAARVRGRGVTVLSACSHAGVVNASLDARRAFGGAAVDVVLGGYHLAGRAMESRIAPTVSDLGAQVRPSLVAPGHCTGWRAKAALAAAFAPGRYGPSVVGTSYALHGR